MYDDVLCLLRHHNTGLCNRSGKTFGEVIHHFIIGADESGFMASANGDAYIVGAAGKRKHKKNTADCRASVTALRTGNVEGETGPAVILLAGKKKRRSFSDKFLERHGAAKRSTIIMTETVFMTTEALINLTPKLMKGYREMPFLKENPQWYFVEITDGFGAHHNSYEAMKLRADYKCLALKEEGDSSHVNQAYDRFVAKGDMKQACDSLGFMRGMRYRCGHSIDQYTLVHVMLQYLCETKRTTWTNSFRACNLDPRTRLDFKAWCDKISPFLLGGQTFKEEEDITAEYIYEMMPAFWKGMTVDERKKLMGLAKSYNYNFTFEMVKTAIKELHIPMANMHGARIVVHNCVEWVGLIDIVDPTPTIE